MTELICIVCPKGCHLHVDEQNGFTVTGNGCTRGAEYGRVELQNPTRVLTSTVRVTGGIHRRCPVKTDRPIPKHLLFDAMKLLDDVTLQAPVQEGQLILSHICQTDANLIASRQMEKEEHV